MAQASFELASSRSRVLPSALSSGYDSALASKNWLGIAKRWMSHMKTCARKPACHISVCTCVVHKRCHLSVVTKCPGMKEAAKEDDPADAQVVSGDVRTPNFYTSLLQIWRKLLEILMKYSGANKKRGEGIRETSRIIHGDSKHFPPKFLFPNFHSNLINFE